MQHLVHRILTGRQQKVVAILSLRKHWSIGEIARELKISSAAATKCVQRLERKGVLSRDVNVFDHRSSLVRLTEKGQRLI